MIIFKCLPLIILQKDYNITLQQEKNKEVIRENQQETGEILQESIPADELEAEEAEEEADKGPAEEPDEPDDKFTKEVRKFISFLQNTVYKIRGQTSSIRGPDIKKTLLSELMYNDIGGFDDVKDNKINETFITELTPIITKEKESNQRAARIAIQEGIRQVFFKSIYIPDDIKKKNRGIFKDEIVGTGYGMNNDNTYITIGKYLVHRNNLLGGKLQVRSPNKNQVYGFKSQNITNNIKDILLKLNKKEPISFKDVDKLNEQEKNQLYTIGKKLHVSELFDIPSTLKSNEDKLKDEFILLRGSLMAGNNNPDLLRKFKIVLLKMKNNKLISLQEYNEVLNILLEIDI
jgi:hypothetical protein